MAKLLLSFPLSGLAYYDPFELHNDIIYNNYIIITVIII